MGFVIPKKFGEDDIPEPAVDNVQIEKRRGGRFAVIRFNGRLNQNTISEAEAKLRSWIEGKNQIADGDAEMAGYDPPWTPGWFRRNEVLIRLR
jgi:hypothetical protein